MYQRSFSLLSPENSQLLVVDIQERLIPVIREGKSVTFNTRRLLDAANVLSVPIVVSEQYPKGLGATLPEILAALPKGTPVIAKRSFSVCETVELLEVIDKNDVPKVVLCGVEAHVCVLQTAFDLMTMGREVYLVVDTVGSRFQKDYETALRRMESFGVTLTTAESVLFEWCRTADHPEFKTISRLARETAP